METCARELQTEIRSKVLSEVLFNSLKDISAKVLKIHYFMKMAVHRRRYLKRRDEILKEKLKNS
jgi:hypothetical protein